MKKAMKMAVALAAAFLMTAMTIESASAHSLDGQSPVSSGCANDAYTAKSGRLWNGSSYHSTARIELRYSPRCRTVWARISGAGVGGIGRVIRRSDDRRMTCQISSGTSCFSPMLYDGGTTSAAYGEWGVWHNRTAYF